MTSAMLKLIIALLTVTLIFSPTFVPQAVGQAAMEMIGVDRFNLTMLLCVPSLAFAAGTMAVLLAAAIIEAQAR